MTTFHFYSELHGVISYNSTISACGRGRQWEKALDLLQEMMDHGIKPNVVSYNSAISACKKGEKWEKAIDLLQEMTDHAIKPNVISYNSTIEACFISDKYSNALSLVHQAQNPEFILSLRLESFRSGIFTNVLLLLDASL